MGRIVTESASVVVSGVGKTFGDRQVLTDLNLEVPAGSFTAVLGPSGCGKSTLLRILAGFESPDAGVVSIAGAVMTSVPAHRRRVGLMPQEGALFPHHSVAGNVAFALGRGSDVTAEVAHWLAVVGLDGLADARPHQLSGGQQQRVALARALAARPRVLLLDEPFAALDAGLRVRVREDITAILRESGTTALLVTHDQSEALSLADSVAVLLDGSIAQHGAPLDLYTRPASLDVARFIGSTIELAGSHRAGSVRTALGSHPVGTRTPEGAVVVVIRPEQLRLSAPGAPEVVDVEVIGRRFYGPETSMRVRLDNGTALELRRPGGVADIDDGERVGIRVAGSVVAFPAG